ncbi:hypothetical protein [Chloroflexus aggregans]|uniref:CRISPR-associated RAMP protein, Cmr4 family n=1 Tax=Chloroflexus aggregans (strain MD-66 / DSM 9485) TaxID=326427 RepID=B8GB46_CHLAD|nr:hypothetical protein [Chloroflexus aggregans]ACL26646.1 conserved hypothetical protein [Chloroflexus aggregans DSM 9485]
MSWKLYRWVWRLEAPLHIGVTPAGLLNRTRLYIPARNIWAALTEELARRSSSASFPDYAGTGRQVQEAMRFSYLYPAEQVNGKWQAWLPQYKQNGNESGLIWCREDGGKSLPDRQFRQRILITRPSTAIDPSADSAAEATLRELECISPWWRQVNGQDSAHAVAMVGYVLCQDDQLHQDVMAIDEIFVGGDVRYGLGHLRRYDQPNEEQHLFGNQVNLQPPDAQSADPQSRAPQSAAPQSADPIVKTQRVLAHTLPNGNVSFIGRWTCIGGWDKGSMMSAHSAWEPGSFTETMHSFAIQKEGWWQRQ